MPDDDYETQVKNELNRLAEYRLALQEEFKNHDDMSDDEIALRSRSRIIELIPDAATQIRYLVNHAESEAVKKDLSKWIVQVGLKHADDSEEGNELKEILKSFIRKDAK